MTDWREESDRRIVATEKAYWGDLYQDKTNLDQALHEDLQAAQNFADKYCGRFFNETARKIARVMVEGSYVSDYEELDKKRVENRAGKDREIEFPHIQLKTPDARK